MYKTASHEKYNTKERVALSLCFIVHIRRSTSAKKARPFVSTFWYTSTDRSNLIECLDQPVKTFHVRWILSSNLSRLPSQEKIAGFLLLIPGTRESKLLQKIGSHVANQLHLPLRPISSPRLYRGNPFKLSLHI